MNIIISSSIPKSPSWNCKRIWIGFMIDGWDHGENVLLFVSFCFGFKIWNDDTTDIYTIFNLYQLVGVSQPLMFFLANLASTASNWTAGTPSSWVTSALRWTRMPYCCRKGPDVKVLKLNLLAADSRWKIFREPSRWALGLGKWDFYRHVPVDSGGLFSILGFVWSPSLQFNFEDVRGCAILIHFSARSSEQIHQEPAQWYRQSTGWLTKRQDMWNLASGYSGCEMHQMLHVERIVPVWLNVTIFRSPLKVPQNAISKLASDKAAFVQQFEAQHLGGYEDFMSSVSNLLPT